MTTTLTQDQLDAIYAAQDDDAALLDLTELEVAKRLAAAGDEAFAGWGDEPAEAPAAEPERPARGRRGSRSSKAAAAAAQETTPAEEEKPKRGRRRSSAQAEPARPAAQAKPAEAEAKQLPAKPAREPKQLPAARPAVEGGIPIDGLDHCTVEDLMVPRLQLKQATTKDEAGTGAKDVPDGDWFLSHDPSEHGDRVVSVLEIRPGRIAYVPWSEEEAERVLSEIGILEQVPEDAKVLCRSYDRLAPAKGPDQEWEPLASACAACEHKEWRKTSSGKPIKPLCAKVYRILAVDLTGGGLTPARLMLKGESYKAGRSLVTSLSFAAKRHRGAPASSFMLELTSQAKSNRKGEYHVAKFGRATLIDDEDLREELATIKASLALDAPHLDDDAHAGAEGSDDEGAE